MITVPAHRVKQFGVEFYQASFSAKDIDRLVKFEVLGYAGSGARRAGTWHRARVNWEMLEKRIGESETAYQRPVIRRKIDELIAYYRECKEAGTLPAIPGAVIITSEQRFTFTPMASQHDLGLLQIPEEHGVLRVLDGQHRLLALHALTRPARTSASRCPRCCSTRLDARQIVELFVTINAKHTRLNPSHIMQPGRAEALPGPEPGSRPRRHPIAERGRDLAPGRRDQDARHRARPRYQAPLAEEIVDFLETVEKIGGGTRIRSCAKGAKRFFLNYMKAVAGIFPTRMDGPEILDQDGRRPPRVHPGGSRRDGARPRAAQGRLRLQRDPRSGEAVGRAAEGPPLRDRRRVEARLAGGTRGTVEALTRELREALRG